jgi:catechol 2,3-dioxygenase-like lactoylglutathione lyase family enzyme
MLKQIMRKNKHWTQLGLLLSLAIAVCIIAHQGKGRAQAPLSPSASSVRLNHITLSVADSDRMSEWYMNTLGFKTINRFTLTRPNGGKIQVVRVAIPGLEMNISQFAGSVSPDRSGERQGWRHLALRVDNVDRTYQQLQARGISFLGEPFTYDPPGYRVAFFRDPEGNTLELYQDL